MQTPGKTLAPRRHGMAFSAPPNSGPAARRPRILLVDDDVVVLRALRRLLLNARPDWEIDSAQSGELAHAVLRKPGREGELLRVLDWALDQRQRRLRDSANF